MRTLRHKFDPFAHAKLAVINFNEWKTSNFSESHGQKREHLVLFPRIGSQVSPEWLGKAYEGKGATFRRTVTALDFAPGSLTSDRVKAEDRRKGPLQKREPRAPLWTNF